MLYDITPVEKRKKKNIQYEQHYFDGFSVFHLFCAY